MPTTQPSAPDATKDPAYGWVMVAVVFTLTALSFGAMGSISVFLKPLSLEFDWSRGETALGYTATSLASAIAGVFWGYVADRAGSRWFGLVAAFAMTSSFLLLSEQTSLYEFYALYFLFGAIGNAMVSTPLYANVGFWFHHKPGLALGITAAGGAFGQGLVPYLVGMIIEDHGWRAAYVSMAWTYLAIALPLALLIRESPSRVRARTEPSSPPPDAAVSEVEAVAWISIAVIFCCSCMAVPIVHLVPLLTDAGASMEYATRVLMVLMFAGVCGRILAGKLADMIGGLRAYILMSLGQTLSVFWFPQLPEALSLYFLAVFFGFTYSGVMTSSVVCARMMISAGFAGRALGITAFFGWLGMGMGGYFGGLLYDINGSYFWSFAFAAMMGCVNLLILGFFYLRINMQQRRPLAV
jgi:MFS family permease